MSVPSRAALFAVLFSAAFGASALAGGASALAGGASALAGGPSLAKGGAQDVDGGAEGVDGGAEARGKAEARGVGPVTGRPLPRFVSLRSRQTNMRVGPGTKYAIRWRYTRPGLPVEVVGEHGNWLHVRDADGEGGWVLHSLLVGRRTAVVAPWSVERTDDGIAALLRTASSPLFDARARPARVAPTVARLQAGTVVRVRECDTRWCAVEARGHRAWLPQSALWGVYPRERIED